MIKYEQNKGSKTLAATTAETITFGSGDVIGSGVRAYHLNLTGTDDDVDSLTTIVVKAGGQTIWTCTEQHHRALIQSLSPSNFDVANADTRLTIPLYFLDRPKTDPAKWNCGFPNGLAPTLEISKDNTGAAGTIFAGYTYDDDPAKLPQFYPIFIASDTNAGASASEAWTPITQKGFMVGFTVVTTNLTSFRLVLGGKTILDLNTAQLLEAQQLGNSDVVTSPVYFRLDEPTAVTLGNSGFYITGNGSWATTNQVGIHTIVPQGQ